MENVSYELSDIFELEEWQKLQDNIAMVTNLSIVMSDYRGVPFTRGSNCTEFCKKARADPGIAKYCYRCDSIGGLEAAKIDAPYIYTCHMGIIDMAVPIMANGKYIGALIGGQIRLADAGPDNVPEQIVAPKTAGKLSEFIDENRVLYEDMPYLTLSELYYSAKLLYHTCGYIVRQATRQYAASNNAPAGIELPHMLINDPRPAFGNLPAAPAGEQADISRCGDEVLKPAFDYIDNNRGIFPAQPDMARLCHLSPSYFSRLFRKETGLTFTNYVISAKTQWAKQLLAESSMSVTDISDALGYSSPSYFIRSFKEHEHMTPHAYRSLVKLNREQ